MAGRRRQCGYVAECGAPVERVEMRRRSCTSTCSSWIQAIHRTQHTGDRRVARASAAVIDRIPIYAPIGCTSPSFDLNELICLM